jgi:cellulose synthase/poly-beta-1,6-N-acetylglucosamine synthase-like glycosyltransferase
MGFNVDMEYVVYVLFRGVFDYAGVQISIEIGLIVFLVDVVINDCAEVLLLWFIYSFILLQISFELMLVISYIYNIKVNCFLVAKKASMRCKTKYGKFGYLEHQIKGNARPL